MDVAERDVIETCENRSIHIVETADGNVLRLCPRCAGHELVRDEHAALFRIRSCLPQRSADGVCVCDDLLIRSGFKCVPHMRGADERQHVDQHFAVFVVKDVRLDAAVVDRGEMHAARFDEAGGERDPLRRVVVAADHEDLRALGLQPAQKIVKKLHRLCGRHSFVVDVSGDQDGIRLFFVDHVQDLRQDVFLVFQHVEFVDPLSEVQVREMNQLHGVLSFEGREVFFTDQAGFIDEVGRKCFSHKHAYPDLHQFSGQKSSSSVLSSSRQIAMQRLIVGL